MDLLRKLGVRKSQEYSQLKTSIKNLTYELNALGSKRLSSGESLRFRNRYKRIVEKLTKERFPPNEYKKLQSLLKEFQGRFQNTGIIEKPTQAMANSDEKCCTKHTTNEGNKISTSYRGRWEKVDSGQELTEKTNKSQFVESGKPNTSSHENITSRFHYENETDQTRKKEQQEIKGNSLAQVHSLQHSVDQSRYKKSRDVNRTSDELYFQSYKGGGEKYIEKSPTKHSGERYPSENIEEAEKRIGLDQNSTPHKLADVSEEQSTQAKENIRKRYYHKSSENLQSPATHFKQREGELLPSSPPSKPSYGRAVTPTQSTRIEENRRNLSHLGSSETSQSPVVGSRQREESQIRTVTPTQSRRIEENSRNLSSETSQNSWTDARQREERHIRAATPTQSSRSKENIRDLSHHKTPENLQNSWNKTYSSLDEFVRSSPSHCTPYVPEERNTLAMSRAQNQERTIRNMDRSIGDQLSTQQHVEATYCKEKSSTPYKAQDKSDSLEVGSKTLSQSSNRFGGSPESRDNINVLDDYLKMLEDDEKSIEGKPNYKNVSNTKQKQEIQKGKELDVNMTGDRLKINTLRDQQTNLQENFGNSVRAMRQLSRRSDEPRIPTHHYQHDPRRSTGNEFGDNFYVQQKAKESLPDGKIKNERRNSRESDTFRSYLPYTDTKNYKACYYQSSPKRSDIRPHETNLDEVINVRPSPRGRYSETNYGSDERYAYRGGHQRSRMRKEEEHVKTEIAQEAVEQPSLQILDVHQYFRDDFDINSIDDTLDYTSKIEILESVAKGYDNHVSNFSEEKFSLEYFVLDEKLMRLIEKLDKIKCHDDQEATNKKVRVIEYIKGLHTKLDERAKED